jgi:hypothetical protein
MKEGTLRATCAELSSKPLRCSQSADEESIVLDVGLAQTERRGSMCWLAVIDIEYVVLWNATGRCEIWMKAIE